MLKVEPGCVTTAPAAPVDNVIVPPIAIHSPTVCGVVASQPDTSSSPPGV